MLGQVLLPVEVDSGFFTRCATVLVSIIWAALRWPTTNTQVSNHFLCHASVGAFSRGAS